MTTRALVTLSAAVAIMVLVASAFADKPVPKTREVALKVEGWSCHGCAQDTKAALEKHGITFVSPNPGEVERWKSISDGAIDEMAASGTISAEIVSQVRGYLQSFRDSQ